MTLRATPYIPAKGNKDRFVPLQFGSGEPLNSWIFCRWLRIPLFPLAEESSLMRVAIYARVSTLHKGQDPENQLRELRAWCANCGGLAFTFGIGRRSPVPSNRLACRPARPEQRYVSSPWRAFHHANASHRAGAKSVRPARFPQSDRPIAAPGRARTL